MSSKSKTVTPERKAALTQLCDSETYVEIIRQSITPDQAKAAKSVPRLGNSEPLALPPPADDNVIEAEIIEPKNDEDDDLEIRTKVPEGEAVAVTRTEEEEKAYQEGRTDFADGDNHDDFNPYDADDEPKLYSAFRQGWMDKRKEHLDGQCVKGMLATTAPKFAKMLETVFSNCITQAEYVGILNLALTTEREGKSREWVISRLTEALTKTEQPVERTAFQQGEDAAGNEHIAETANPYEPGTVDHDDWLEGFRSARGED